MTRDELYEFMGDGEYSGKEIADRILAAIAKEREGDVVLWKGKVNQIAFVAALPESFFGLKGRIVFQPDKEEK